MIFDQISKFRTQCVFKNVKMKASVAVIVHELNASYTEPAQSLPEIWKIARRVAKVHF